MLLSFKMLKTAQLIQFPGFIPIHNMYNAFLSLEGLVNPDTALLEETQLKNHCPYNEQLQQVVKNNAQRVIMFSQFES